MIVSEIVSFFECLSSQTLQRIVQANAEINYVGRSGDDIQHDVVLKIRKLNAKSNYFVLTEMDHEVKNRSLSCELPRRSSGT